MNNYKDLNDYELIYMISENNEDATNLLFSKYKPIVLKLANEYYRKSKGIGQCGLELEDFIQEGYCALYNAIHKYSSAKNTIFYTYAIICIKGKLINLLVGNASDKYMALNSSISLNTNLKNGSDDFDLMDIISDRKSLNPVLALEYSDLEDKLEKLIFSLEFEEGIICELKINGYTGREIAKLLDDDINFVYRTIIKLRKNLTILIEKNNF